jgi:hypothetical protein
MRISLRRGKIRKPNPAYPWLLAKQAEYETICVDAFDWLQRAKPNSIHAVVTDPPYGAP